MSARSQGLTWKVTGVREGEGRGQDGLAFPTQEKVVICREASGGGAVCRGMGDGYMGEMGRSLRLRAPRYLVLRCLQGGVGGRRTLSTHIRPHGTDSLLPSPVWSVFFLWSVAQMLPAARREFEETG